MRSIKFDQLRRKAPIAPPAMAPGAALAAGTRVEADPNRVHRPPAPGEQAKLEGRPSPRAGSDSETTPGSQKP